FAGPYITWHIKTLHLEEVFYLAAALVVVTSNRKLPEKLAFLLGLVITIRISNFIGKKFGFDLGEEGLSYTIAFDPIIIGSFAGLEFERLRQSRIAAVVARGPTAAFLGAMVVIFAIGCLRQIKPFSYVLQPTWPTLISLLCLPILLSFYDGKSALKNKAI